MVSAPDNCVTAHKHMSALSTSFLPLRAPIMCIMILTYAMISTTISSPVLDRVLLDAHSYLVGDIDACGLRLTAHKKLTKLLASPGTLRHHM